MKAVLCVSAHWETPGPAVSAAPEPETIHDFYGFPAELYRVSYPARGGPELAHRVADLAGKAGLDCDVDDFRGLDHGAWVPLVNMYPKAGVPVLQLSIQHHLDPAKHHALGLAIEPLRHEGILVVGSGGAVHPLGYPVLLEPGAKTQAWALEFSNWLTDAITRGDTERLIKYRSLAPHPERAHPRPDHYMPLMTALGAAGPKARGKLIHDSWYWGNLGMAAYEFRAPASGKLKRKLQAQATSASAIYKPKRKLQAQPSRSRLGSSPWCLCAFVFRVRTKIGLTLGWFRLKLMPQTVTRGGAI